MSTNNEPQPALIHIEKILEKCSDTHTFNEAYYKDRHLFWVGTFLEHLESALERLSTTHTPAYNDFIRNKLVAAENGGFNRHSLLSALCELCIMNTFIMHSDTPDSFCYEPKLRVDNRKNVEFSITIKGVIYLVEVKSPNLENYYNTLCSKLENHGAVTRFDTRAFGKPTQDNQMPSPSMRVKDFLVDADLKFPQSNFPQSVNVLFIAWDDNNDQPCIELKHPMHGLLTPNSWYKDAQGCPITFPNIDLIFVSDLYQNLKAHMSSGDVALPDVLTGVPYFERNAAVSPEEINPFNLASSRNVFIKTEVDLNSPAIENLPIAFPYQYVDVVDEEYVKKYATDIKISYKAD